MTWFSAMAFVLPKKFPSPAYSAVMAWRPWDKEELIKRPRPLARLTGRPSAEPSALNCTVPVGIPAPGATALTIAARTRFEPVVEGLAEHARVAAEEAAVTVNWPEKN